MIEIEIRTSKQVELIDITHDIEKIIKKTNIKDGICYIYTPHTTCAITINENADPSVKSDIITELNKIVPFNDNYSHSEGNAAAHIKASIIGPSEVVFIENNLLKLGTWQGIYFCEFDGPRRRKVYVKCVSSA